MAIYRNVSMTFWTDSKIVDDFSPEDKYFYLYLLTNPHTNLCGCYEISMKQIADEMGYGVQKVKGLVKKLEKEHDVIRYNKDTKEVLVLKWNRYNWTKSEKFRVPLSKEIEAIKCEEFKLYLTDIFDGKDTVSIGYRYTTDTTVSVSDTDTDTVSDTVSDKYSAEREEIIAYFNEICGTKYRPDTKAIKKLIDGLLDQNFTVDDFKTVIYKKAKQWLHDPEMCKFVRPQTLFTGKFEGYLNEVEALSFEERLWMA